MRFYLIKISKWNGERKLRTELNLGSGNQLPFRRLPTSLIKASIKRVSSSQLSAGVSIFLIMVRGESIPNPQLLINSRKSSFPTVFSKKTFHLISPETLFDRCRSYSTYPAVYSTAAGVIRPFTNLFDSTSFSRIPEHLSCGPSIKSRSRLFAKPSSKQASSGLV